MLFEAILFLNFNFDNFNFLTLNFDFTFLTLNLFDINFIYLNNFFLLDNFECINSNFENAKNIYHYSIPVTKLYYPEPFVAMPSFLHYDPWFFHILIYQYWLWFLFIFLVVFFFLIFICTLRWTNPRIKPRRETRGVSRSKCGDLITATVPTTWAGSIIIHESTDAIDFYDGFGTSELVIGIRAFQWGWEYYYPKDIDLNYNININNSFYFGNSLKYVNTNAINSYNLKYWRFYQLKPSDSIVNPLNFFLLNTKNFLNLNSFNTSNIGQNTLNEVNSFKKIYFASSIFNKSSLNSFFNFNNSFLNQKNFELENINNLIIERPSSYLSLKNNFFSNMTFFDLKSISILVSSNLNIFKVNKLDGNLSQLYFSKNNLNYFLKHSKEFFVSLNKDFSFSKGLQDSEFLKKESLIRENLENELKIKSLKLDLNKYNYFFKQVKNDSLYSDFFFNENLISIKSTNPFFDLKNFDLNSIPFSFEIPILVSADDEIVNNSFTSNFWNTTFPFLNEGYRVNLNTFFNLNFLKTYTPSFFLYADYDFRRWQNGDLIEDFYFDTCGINNSFFDFFFYINKANDYSFLLKNYIFDLKKYIYIEKTELKKKIF